MLLGMVATPALAATSGPVAQSEGPAEIDPQVLTEISEAGATDFFVWMKEKADLSPAAGLKTKLEKGTFVFNALQETAKRTQKDLLAYLDVQGVKYRSYYIANKVLVRAGGEALVMNLAARPDVGMITPNHKFQLQEPFKNPNAPESPEAIEPNITFINADDVWAMGITGQGTVLAGNDTGLDWDHPALIDHYRGWDGSAADHNYSWWDATGTYPTVPNDGHGHGTHTGGTMVGDDGGTNQIGVAPGAQIIHCKNMDNGGGGDDGTFSECFEWDLAPWDLSGANPDPAMAPDAINNSWGYFGGDQPQFEDEIAALQAAGIVVEVSAGNEGDDCTTLRSPGDYAEVITTGSVNHAGGSLPGTLTGFSSRGPSLIDPADYMPDVMAPGENIRSSIPGGGYDGTWSGTSMAGPHVTALIGLMWSASPALEGQVETTYEIIQNTAVPLIGVTGSNCGGDYTEGPNNDWGFGTIDAYAAVQEAMAYAGGFLEGTVTDAVSGDPIAEATIAATLSPTQTYYAETDALGYYGRNLMEGTYDVTSSRFGYLSQTAEDIVITEGMTVTQDFALTPAPAFLVQGNVYDLRTSVGSVDVLVEDFESWPPAGWSIVNYGGTCVWDTNVHYGRTNYAGGEGLAADADSDACGFGTTMNTGLLSPVMDLSAYHQSSVDFIAAYNDIATGGETFQVDVSSDGGTTWTNLLVWDADHSPSGPGEVVSLDLSGYASSQTQVRFQYLNATWDWWAQVDQVVVTGVPTGRPLYARIDIAGVPDSPFWTDPLTGYYEIELPAGIPFDFTVSAFSPGYLPENRTVGPLVGPTIENFALDVDAVACTAPGYAQVGGIYQGFETWPIPGWSIVDNVGGLVWDSNDAYGVYNFTGGGGYAATVDSNYNSGVPYDTELRTYPFDLSALVVQSLKYKFNFQSYSGLEALDVDISPDGGASWFNLRHWTTDQGSLYALPGAVDNIDLSAYGYSTNAVIRWRYYTSESSPWDWYAQVDEVTLGEVDCQPLPGGLVLGNVYDANTLEPMNGADVWNDAGFTAISVGTPDDPDVADGFYTIFSPSGDHWFLATIEGYGGDEHLVAVPETDAVGQDFFLPAGWLTVTPPALSQELMLGETATQTLMLENLGSPPVYWEMLEVDRGFTPVLAVETDQPPVASIEQSASDGNFPRGTAAPSFGRAPLTGSGAPAPSSPIALPQGTLAYAVEAVNDYFTGFDLDVPEVLPNLAAYTTYVFPGAGEYVDGYIYVVDGTTMIKLDPTGTVMETLPVTPPSGSQSYTGMALDPTDATVYLASCDISASYLYTLDVETGDVVMIGEITNSPCSIAIAVDGNGDMYSHDLVNDTMLWIDKTTGAGTEIGPLGFDANFGQGMGWDQATDTLYLAAFNYTTYQAELRIGDRSTGNTTLVGVLGATEPGSAQVPFLAVPIQVSAGVPWLSEDPISGTLPGMLSQDVTITFDASVVAQPGQYNADLVVQNDTPYGTLVVPLTMTVTAPPTWGKLEGVVQSLGYCDANPSLLEGAGVLITTATGVTHTLVTDEDGYYSIWMAESDSPLTIEVTYDEHVDGYADGVAITAGATTTQNFDLRWLAPCVGADPELFDVEVAEGYTARRALMLDNAGAASTAFEISEIGLSAAAGTITRLPEAVPADARTAPRGVGRSMPVRTATPDDLLLEEGFEAGIMPPADWSVVVNNSYTWKVNNFDPHGGSYNADVEYDPGLQQQDEWVVSPEFALSEGMLSFWSFGSLYWCRDTYDNCDLNVWIVVGDVGGGDDVMVGTADADWPDNWIWAQSVFDLTPYLPGGPVRIGFQYYGVDGAQVSLDDVVLDGTIGADVPWLSEDPITGTLDADSLYDIDVTFDSMTYTVDTQLMAMIRINSDDPEVPTLNVPVTMTIVAPFYGVEAVLLDDSLTGAPGETVTYTLQVTNTSNGPTDSFNIAVSDDDWAATAPASVGPLGPGASALVEITVAIPADAEDESFDVAAVTVTSQGDPTKSVELEMTTTADLPYGVVVEPEVDAASGNVGETVEYTLQVTNIGNITNTFAVTASGNAWEITFSADSLVLGAGESVELVVTVAIPADAADGDQDVATVEVSGTGGAVDTATLTTTAVVPTQFIYLPLVMNLYVP